jgi:hypothetical protein
VDFVLTIPQVGCQSSESIFYASFLALCQIKEANLSEFQRRIVASHITDLNNVSEIKDIIVAAYTAEEGGEEVENF